MVLRSVIKVVLAAGEAVTKAFGKAVKEEIRTAQQAASRQSASGGGSSSSTQSATAANAKLGITLQEAIQILDVKPPLNAEDVEKRYKFLFQLNDKAKGGSFYLQSKVYRAKERIDDELARATEDAAGGGAGSSEKKKED